MSFLLLLKPQLKLSLDETNCVSHHDFPSCNLCLGPYLFLYSATYICPNFLK
jgi:hypothetical protein